MMAEANMLSEAEILGMMLAPDDDHLEPSAAQAVLRLRFADATVERIRILMAKNSAGEIEASERSELESYLRAGQAVDLWKARARKALAAPQQSP
jgi:hypothetical protein